MDVVNGPFVLAIDQSTQGTKVLLLDKDLSIVHKAYRPHKQYINDQGWVEHDAEEIMTNVLACARDVCKKAQLHDGDLSAIGITNQRETCLAWDSTTREPLAPAIVWQCGRAEELCQNLQESAPELAAQIETITGLPLSPYFSAAKMRWLLKNVSAVRQAREAHTLRFGTIDSWLIYKLCEDNPHVTEPSNASRTQLYSLQQKCWSSKCLELFDINESELPQILASDADFGITTLGGLFKSGVPVRAVLGDSQAALFAHGTRGAGDVKVSYGTGSSVMMLIGDSPLTEAAGLSQSVAWDIDGETSYVVEGNITYSAQSMNWIKDELHLVASFDEIEELCAKANPHDECIFVPAFNGLGAPWWNNSIRAGFVGMSRTTGRAEMVRSCVASIALQVADVIEALRLAAHQSVQHIYADGGASTNAFLMQLQADIAEADVLASSISELSAMGVAMIASKSSPKHQRYKQYTLKHGCAETLALRRRWQKAIACLTQLEGDN